jgi:cytoskeleton protein RodZ
MSEPRAAAPAADAGSGAPGPGARLQAERERRGLTLGAVAESLHVAPRIVSAMEANEFDAFDAPVYAKGFLRKYAGFLGIPADEVLAGYEALTARPAQPTLIPTMNVTPARPSLAALPIAPALIVAALVLAAGSYWWWAGHAPARVATPAAADGRAAAEREAPAAGNAVPALQPASALPPVEAPPAAAASARVLEPAAVPVATPAAPRRGAAGERALVIHGVRDCWVEVYAPSGARLVYDLLAPGETRTAPGPGPWRVFLGYADGARLTVGDRAVAVPLPHRNSATARFVVARDGAVQ